MVAKGLNCDTDLTQQTSTPPFIGPAHGTWPPHQIHSFSWGGISQYSDQWLEKADNPDWTCYIDNTVSETHWNCLMKAILKAEFGSNQ